MLFEKLEWKLTFNEISEFLTGKERCAADVALLEERSLKDVHIFLGAQKTPPR